METKVGKRKLPSLTAGLPQRKSHHGGLLVLEFVLDVGLWWWVRWSSGTRMKLQRISTAGVLVRGDTNQLRLSCVYGSPALPAFGQSGKASRYGVRKSRNRQRRQSKWLWLDHRTHRRAVADCIQQMARLCSPTPPLRDRRTWTSVVTLHLACRAGR